MMELISAISGAMSLLGKVFKWDRVALPFLGSGDDRPEFGRAVAERFAQYFELLQEYDEDLTIARLAESLGYPNTELLAQLARGDCDPSFSDLDEFADCAILNSEWLKHGDPAPFYTDGDSPLDPLETLETFRDQWPERLFFVRSMSDEGEVVLVAKYGEFRWKIFIIEVHFSAQNGGTGAWQLLQFYHLAKAFLERSFEGTFPVGRSVEKAQFDGLLNGTVFPPSAINLYHSRDDWWMDFTNLRREYDCHGPQFTQARQILKEQLNYT